MGLLDSIFQAIRTIFYGPDKPLQQQQDATWQVSPGPIYPPQQYPQSPKRYEYPQQYQRPQQYQQYQYSQQYQRPQQPQQPQPPSPPKPSKPSYTRIDDSEGPRSNPYYQQLRSQAREKGDAMSRAFDASQAAYSRGNRAEAKQLSNEGKRHKSEMERLDQEASDWIFQHTNMDRAADEVDLHGLYVKEAIARTESAVLAAQGRGDTQIRIIVGKGLHSQGNVARLKPAIEELMAKYQLNAHVDPYNAGVLVVQLGGRGTHGMDPNEVTRRLEKDEQCMVM